VVERKIYERDRHDGDAVACMLTPQNLGTGVTDTDTVNMQGFDQVLWCLLGGVANDAAATLDAVVMECTQANDAGGDAKVLTGLLGSKAITQFLADAAFSVLDDKWLLHVRTEEMDVDAGFNFLFLRITVSAGDSWYLACEAVRSSASYEPVAVTNITEVIP